MKKEQEEQIAPGKVIEITEVFDTTPERLFKAWTNEKDFTSWFGPEGFEVIHCKLDVRVGGNRRSGITDKDGDEHWMEGEYMEIVENVRLVFTFNDGSEKKDPNQATIVTVSFSRSGDQTVMNFNQSVFKTVESRDNHHSGWSSGFVCLRNHINASK